MQFCVCVKYVKDGELQSGESMLGTENYCTDGVDGEMLNIYAGAAVFTDFENAIEVVCAEVF